MFQISPADLPWWEWLLCGVASAIIGFIVALVIDYLSKNKHGGCIAVVVQIIFYVIALLCLIIGLIRFVKSVWE
jgi:hypothetical protein